MAFMSKLPSEILTIVFQNLCCQDLVSCSRTCWTWNDTANPILYETVTISSQLMFQQFIRSITDVQKHNGKCVQNTISRRQRLGLLVKIVDILTDFCYNDGILGYSTRLSMLAYGTPNVHTSKLFPPIFGPVIDNDTRFEWSTLASQWTKLTNLTLKRSTNYCVADEKAFSNINDALIGLQYLDVSSCNCILTYMLPSLPTMPQLQSIVVGVRTTSDYQALKTILKTCQSTLHTLIMEFWCLDQPGSFDLDDLNIGYKQLKAFGLTTDDGSHISITNFGNNLEHFEWWSQTTENSITRDHVSQAMTKTNNLKTLSLNDDISCEDVALALESNKNTLHTFYFNSFDANDLIVLLLENKVRLNKVTRLCFECVEFQNHYVPLLAEVFPNVEFLALSKFRLKHENSSWGLIPEENATIDVRWIEMEALSHFKHLKAIDKITSLELTDPPSVPYQICDILPSGSMKHPRAMPMPFN